MEQLPSISLIGMPGVGKSSVGILLAKLCGLRFMDTDVDIQVREGATLEEILLRDGYRRLREIEEEVLLGLDLSGAVIATGGSVVYSDAVMQRLAAQGPVVYLRAELATLQARVAAAPPRGIASDSKQGFAEIFAERTPLYQRYATLSIDTRGLDPAQVAGEILAQVSSS
ncbi:shikimate kinase [Haliea sp. E17]|uniref:shikimate kinase n=1 Tax=Haliea sp. E17 TaxID=3401576 RepID=UPI003AAD99F0